MITPFWRGVVIGFVLGVIVGVIIISVLHGIEVNQKLKG